MGVDSLPKTVTRQRRDCDLNPGPSAPESSTLTTRLPRHLVRPLNVGRYLHALLLPANTNATLFAVVTVGHYIRGCLPYDTIV